MNLKNKLKTLAVALPTLLVLSACSPAKNLAKHNQPTAMTILKKSEKATKISSVRVKLNTQGKDSMKLVADLTDEPKMAHFNINSSESTAEIWIKDSKTYVKQKSRVYELPTSSQYEDVLKLNNASRYKQSLKQAESNKKWKILTIKDQYRLSYTAKELNGDQMSAIANGLGTKTTAKDLKNIKVQNVKYNYYFDKKTYELEKIVMSYDTKQDGKTTKNNTEVTLNQVNKINIPNSVTKNAVKIN